MIQRGSHDFHRGVHRNSHHHHVALLGDLLGRGNAVNMSCLQGLLLVLLPLVATQHPGGKARFLQSDGQRTADQSQTDHSYGRPLRFHLVTLCL